MSNNQIDQFKNKHINIFTLTIEISFKTLFLIQYKNELNEHKYIERIGSFYSREFYFTESQKDFFCMLFVNNYDYCENEVAKIYLKKKT
jgi:hypothetical protein